MVKSRDPESRRLSQEHRESKAGRSAYIARSLLAEQQQQQSKVSKIKIKQTKDRHVCYETEHCSYSTAIPVEDKLRGTN